jgi:CheY-like chemotaxis protein
MGKSRILIVEDDSSSRKLLRDYLSAKGYDVLEAGEGEEAIDIVIAEKPDLVLMDVLLPDINGLEAVKIIKAKPEVKDIPIIAVTALAMKEDKEKCLACGCIDYITKPINIVEFGNKIGNFLAEKNNTEI